MKLTHENDSSWASPSFVQPKKTDDLDYVLVYIDDIPILQKEGETEEGHLQKLETVLSQLENKGFGANLRKTFFMQKELKYLGYLLIDKGVKPQQKKVEAMRRIKTPTNSKQLK